MKALVALFIATVSFGFQAQAGSLPQTLDGFLGADRAQISASLRNAVRESEAEKYVLKKSALVSEQTGSAFYQKTIVTYDDFGVECDSYLVRVDVLDGKVANAEFLGIFACEPKAKNTQKPTSKKTYIYGIHD